MKKLMIYLAVISMPALAVDSKLYLLHINGLNTTQAKAQLNQQKYLSVNTGAPSANWGLIYNPTQSGSEWGWVASIKGFIDVCIQKWYEINQLPSFDEFTQQAMKAQGVDYPVGSEQYKLFQSNLVEQFQQLLLDDGGKNMGTIVDEFHQLVPSQYADVLNLLSRNGTTDYSNSKDYVILLPHSQGNIYANNLYQYLTQTESFNNANISIFGYASPAKITLGQMECNVLTPNYITSSNDGVIASSRLFFGKSEVLPSNITIAKNESDTSGHGLIENYLSDKSSINGMNDFLNVTSNNCFKDLHTYSQIGTNDRFDSSSKIVFDEASKSLVQLGQDGICEFNTEQGAGWSCINLQAGYSFYSDSISKDGLGNIFISAMEKSYKGKPVVMTYKHKIGISNIESVAELYYGYENGKFYSSIRTTGNISSFDIGTKETHEYDIFAGAQIYDFQSYAITNNSIFISSGLSYPNPSISSQVMFQNLASGEVKNFANILLAPVYNLTIANNIIYICSLDKIFYLPLSVKAGQNWLELNHGCDRIAVSNDYLFFTEYNKIYKYKL